MDILLEEHNPMKVPYSFWHATAIGSLLVLAGISILAFTLASSGQSLDYHKGDIDSKIPSSLKSLNKDPKVPQLIGSNGNYTITSADTVLNEYAVLASDASAGSTTITVTNAADLDSPIPEIGPLSTGDLLMIIQMQGATINTSDSVDYGSVTALNGAGSYEIVYVSSVAGNDITINNRNCVSGLRNSYSAAGKTQVVRIPHFLNLTVNASASIVPEPWNGTTGGVLALRIFGTLLIDGVIDGSGRGFRGGVYRSIFWSGITTYRTALLHEAAAKGEGIAGFGPEYDLLFGRYGRGAPANAGGGGNSHNGGGGGGANGNNGNPWSGQGAMVGGSNLAWALDPGYIANGNARTDSSGGGRGGYTLSLNDLDAEVNGPNDPAWGTPDERREVGGLGGRPVNNDPASRLFLGGGGGAGEANNNVGGDGGDGGGIVFLIADTITGSGSIRSNGQAGADALSPGNDAGSGGGAGGTIVLYNANLTTVPIDANGGRGGNQDIVSSNEAAGPGGGGGGGFIAVRTGAPVRTANGGTSGTTTSDALSEFPANGATSGAVGQNGATVDTIPFCFAPTAAGVTLIGRAATPDGMGIPGALIVVTRQDGFEVPLLTNPFGYFELDGIDAGETLIVSIKHKRYIFFDPVRVITPIDSVSEIEFIAAE